MSIPWRSSPSTIRTPSPDIPKELYDRMRKELQRALGVRDATQERADALVHGVIHIVRGRRSRRLQRKSAAVRHGATTFAADDRGGDTRSVEWEGDLREQGAARRGGLRRACRIRRSRGCDRQNRAEHHRRSAKQVVVSPRPELHSDACSWCSSAAAGGIFRRECR